MRKVSTKGQCLAALSALDKSPKSCMRKFVQDGGLEILERWLRKAPAARYACLLVLLKLPVSLPDLQKASKLMPTVTVIQREESAEENGKQALAVMERWKALFSPPSQPGEVVEPPTKRPRPQAKAAAAAPQAAGAAPAAPAEAPPQPRTPPLSQLPGAKSEDIPPELAGLDPRIALVLMENSALLELLKKQKILQNLSPQNLEFLGASPRDFLSSFCGSFGSLFFVSSPQRKPPVLITQHHSHMVSNYDW